MTIKHRGELEIELGLGLPRMTTIQRLAYTPPNDGYVVFDTDLKRNVNWNVTDGWIFIVGGSDKINAVDGIASETLVLKNASDVDAVAFSTGSALSPALDASTVFGAGGGITLSPDGRTVTGPNVDTQHQGYFGNVDTHKTSGKWYWEIVDSNESSDSSGRGFFGVALMPHDGGNTITYSDFSGNQINWTLANNGVLFDGNDPSQAINNTSAARDARSWIDQAPVVTVSFLLDIEGQTLTIKANGGNTTVISLNTYPQGGRAYAPVMACNYSRLTTFNFIEDDFIYPLPAGFQPLGGAAQTKQTMSSTGADATMSASDESFVFSYESLSFELADTAITTNKPIHGVAGTDPTSLALKSYADLGNSYFSAFVIADWVTVGDTSTITIPLATHGMAFSTGDSFVVVVSELVDTDRYTRVELSTFTNTNGDVIVETRGGTFDGSVNISV